MDHELGSKQLAAILFSDIVNFSAQMGQSEKETIRRVRADLDLMSGICTSHGGDVLKSTGDGLLMYFRSAADAVSCAMEIQRGFSKRKEEAGEGERPLEHRIGIHLGDVFLRDGDAMGDGVNIAARLESEAEPGGICISQTVYDVVRGKIDAEAVSLGARELKNIQQSVHVYQILLDAVKQSQSAAEMGLVGSMLKKMRLLSGLHAAGIIAVAVLIGILVFQNIVARSQNATPPPAGKPKPIASVAIPESSWLSLEWAEKGKDEFGLWGKNEYGMRFRYIGSPSREIWIQDTEVTRGQWGAILGWKPAVKRPQDDVDEHPATGVTWLDCQVLLMKMGEEYRMPLEREWVHAARAGSNAVFLFGNDPVHLSEYAWYRGNAVGGVQPVAQKKPNRWGLYDIHGNVTELVEGEFPPPNTPMRMGCGGGWGNSSDECKVDFRFRITPLFKGHALGVRVVRAALPKGPDRYEKATVEPLRLVVDGHALEVHGSEQPLWAKSFTASVGGAVIDDIDGDGSKEVVVGLKGKHEPDNGKVIVYSASGAEERSFFVYQQQNYQGMVGDKAKILALCTADLYGLPSKQIIASSANGMGWYPSEICVFGVDGRKMANYWHPGHLFAMAVDSQNEDGPPFIVASGANNTLGGHFEGKGYLTTVMLLDPRNMAGEAPPYPGFSGRGTQKWYGIVTPKGFLPQRIELKDSDENGKKEIHLELRDGSLLVIDFNGKLLSVSPSDTAPKDLTFQLIR